MRRWLVYYSGYRYNQIRTFYALAEGLVHSDGRLATEMWNRWVRFDP